MLGDVKCSARLFDDVAARGGVPGMCRSGHSLVRAALREQGALLAGELSGHIFHRENWYGFDDATYCAARLLCILSRLGEPLSALPGWPRAWITPELNLPLPGSSQVPRCRKGPPLVQGAFPRLRSGRGAH